MDSSFTAGDNSKVVPTDTCKNTVYCIANMHNFSTMEEFGILLGRHFLSEYPDIVRKVNITIKQDNWERLTSVPNSAGRPQPHNHAFKRVGPQTPFTAVTAEKGLTSSEPIFSVTSGFRSLDLLKTTQSGFVDFHHNRFTSLPAVTDRLLGTSADCEWTYNQALVNRGAIQYGKVFKDIETALINTFAGPADKGVYSPSVQETLYKVLFKLF